MATNGSQLGHEERVQESEKSGMKEVHADEVSDGTLVETYPRQLQGHARVRRASSKLEELAKGSIPLHLFLEVEASEFLPQSPGSACDRESPQRDDCVPAQGSTSSAHQFTESDKVASLRGDSMPLDDECELGVNSADIRRNSPQGCCCEIPPAMSSSISRLDLLLVENRYTITPPFCLCPTNRQVSDDHEPTGVPVWFNLPPQGSSVCLSMKPSERNSKLAPPQPHGRTEELLNQLKRKLKEEVKAQSALSNTNDLAPLTRVLAAKFARRSLKKRTVRTVIVPAVDGPCEIPKDIYMWRKYGQKPIKESSYPRSYYRCSITRSCTAKKQVERSSQDPTKFVITYSGDHDH